MPKVKLLAPHEHDGKPQQTGAEIDLSEVDAAWLINRGVAEMVNTKPAQSLPTDKKAGE